MDNCYDRTKLPLSVEDKLVNQQNIVSHLESLISRNKGELMEENLKISRAVELVSEIVANWFKLALADMKIYFLKISEKKEIKGSVKTFGIMK